MNWTITPAQLFSDIGWKGVKRGNWLTTRRCPFCDGGSSGDAFTFAVHAADGNFFCHRGKCGVKGTFWGLLEAVGRNPKDYIDKDGKKATNGKKKKFIYS